MKSIKDMTSAELAAFIQSQLMEKGIDVVLSGGACVSFYSQNVYLSDDLDFINIHFAKRRQIREAMEEIGFTEDERFFSNPDTRFFIEFPAGPLAVGKEPVSRVDEHRLATGLLRIISPTDCVKDRLAAFYHWNDLQCLEQASMVAKEQEIDIEEIGRWSDVEGKGKEFVKIRDRLISSKS